MKLIQCFGCSINPLQVVRCEEDPDRASHTRVYLTHEMGSTYTTQRTLLPGYRKVKIPYVIFQGSEQMFERVWKEAMQGREVTEPV